MEGLYYRVGLSVLDIIVGIAFLPAAKGEWEGGEVIWLFWVMVNGVYILFSDFMAEGVAVGLIGRRACLVHWAMI